jgi:hypothetical protein
LQQQCKAGMCTLVHFARPFGSANTMGGAWPAPDDNKMSGLLSLRSITPGPGAGPGGRSGEPSGPGSPAPDRSTSGSPAALVGARQSGRQLPLLGALGGGSPGAEERPDRIVAGTIGELDGGTEAADNLMQAISGDANADKVDGIEVEAVPQRRTEDSDRAELRGAASGGEGSVATGGRRSTTPMLAGPGGLWKVQSERGTGRSPSPYTGLGKKRPVFSSSGLGARSAGAIWRENSAPAATRSF